ncbi:Cof-type HAD-IIB family hydrolase [Listeria ivanovii]|uniref:Cof-type HAD-IIB family hydrolase n=1 Tax=Listeria ivanovii TaxID=1638 RepID=UPI000DA889E7|nr:Cof-type HAD-IIB family hydrolase [Listeria ivanovii]PZF90393.1 Cof-type HAD-IIB family hydrolase [Listeria ivanovii]PZF95712.1 Cof-type HAD-IIB family hydrolase [Listeria ivanovii]PZG05989.1 Cof-type HAD-IIB family hydrolase [Listeria ivanovii]PZG10826.1 Cof-type HAD-IIB family hydrolase [Listeria ivanovii]PZG27909.1 Cof-type HAD-IIB family hydrolase [Listeria ivanovii]
MSKIVFFDVDGTLVGETKEIPASAKQAIAELKENGIYVAIATGRGPFMLDEIRKELGIDSYICYNGQYVIFEGKEIFAKPLPTESLERLISVATEHEHPIVFSGKESMRANLPDHDRVTRGMDSIKRGYLKVDANYYKGRDIFQCLLFCEESFDAYYRKEFKQYGFLRWHEVSVDVCPADGSKAEGIKQMIKQLGFSMEDTYAFGDGVNDIKMLEAVGTGVAMGNCRDEVKEVADYVTSHVDDDGVYNALKHLQLI